MQTGAPLNFEQLAAQIGGTGGFGGKATQGTQTGPPPSMATQLLQGITGGTGTANSLFGGGPGGTSAAGNIAGGLGSWLNGLNLGGYMGVPAATAFLA